jgi:hypothetical protein
MPQSATDKQLAERIENDFTYHPPVGDQPKTYESIRSLAKMLALYIAEACPDGREKSTALTRLEESVFWANASLARRGV